MGYHGKHRPYQEIEMKLKFILLSLASLVLPLAAISAEEPIQPGMYALTGKNPGGDKKYDGKIIVQKEGSNYRISWFIGANRSQAQTGIGILENGVLSIGYADASGMDLGVVSMRVLNNKHLKGKWASLFSNGTFGEEEFKFESEKIPSELKFKQPKVKGQSI